MQSNPELINDNKNPTVFISYSHDKQDHLDRVLDLSNNLRKGGIETILDQYVNTPEEGWPRWMEQSLRFSDFVLMICTKIYVNSVLGNREAGKGLGVRWESHLIYQHIYNQGTMNKKFIPVLLDDISHNELPIIFQSTTSYNLKAFNFKDTGFKNLYLRLTGSINTHKETLGNIIRFQIESVERSDNFLSKSVKLFDNIEFQIVDSEMHNHLVSIASFPEMRDSIIDVLLKKMTHSNDPCERYWIYISLGRIGGKKAKQILTKGIEEENSFAKKGAQDGLQILLKKTES